jgi:endonuclease/exonuclease/phosphatase (EEP) superfamily protein YafD
VELLISILHWLIVGLGLTMVGGTLISRVRSPHWFIRGWDFPRVQITVLLALSAVVYAIFFQSGTSWGWAFIALCAGGAGWQFYRVFPYLPFGKADVERAPKASDGSSVRLLASNVLQENDQFDRWLDVVREADPDIILALEVDDRWDEAISALEDDYPHTVRYPQDNYYGMVLYSRLKLIDPELRFIIEDDVPSIHTEVELEGGRRIHLHGVHPRPPEPLRDEDSTARDAEVVIVGREIDAEDGPAIVAGDFNDVAWSHTSELFQRVSGLLDPRKGRGFFNTFHARYPLIRWPLDHVFHSNDFKLVSLQLLPFVGSDHFPVCITIDCEPAAPADQPEPEKSAHDEEEAQEKVERAAEENGEEVMENEGAHPQEESVSDGASGSDSSGNDSSDSDSSGSDSSGSHRSAGDGLRRQQDENAGATGDVEKSSGR